MGDSTHHGQPLVDCHIRQCMCVYMCVCVHVCVCACVSVHVCGVCMCRCVHVWVGACVDVPFLALMATGCRSDSELLHSLLFKCLTASPLHLLHPVINETLTQSLELRHVATAGTVPSEWPVVRWTSLASSMSLKGVPYGCGV